MSLLGQLDDLALTGFTELDRRLSRLSNMDARKVARAAVNAGLRVISAEIKSKIPGQYKDARRAVGTSFKKAKFGSNVGQLCAKAGLGVGKGAKNTKKRAGKKGVGISKQNIHWFVLGTEDRYTGTRSWRTSKGGRRSKPTGKARRFTGRMPAVLDGVVQSAVSSGSAPAVQKMKEVLAAKIKQVAHS